MTADLTDDEREAVEAALTEESREWIEARAATLFRESERARGGVRPQTIIPQDFLGYFVVTATVERLLALGWSPRRAGAAETGAGVRVRALEWERYDGDQHCFSGWTAPGIGGNYTIEERTHGGFYDLWFPKTTEGTRCGSRDEAVGKAQGHFDAAILSALEPAAPTPDAISAAEARGRTAGVEAAANWAEETACGGYLDGPSGERVASGLRALSSIPPQEAPK